MLHSYFPITSFAIRTLSIPSPCLLRTLSALSVNGSHIQASQQQFAAILRRDPSYYSIYRPSPYIYIPHKIPWVDYRDILQWLGMWDVGSARNETAQHPTSPTILKSSCSIEWRCRVKQWFELQEPFRGNLRWEPIHQRLREQLSVHTFSGKKSTQN